MFNFFTQSITLTNLPEFLLIFGIIFTIYLSSWIIGRILKLVVKKLFWINADIRNGFIVLITLAQVSVSLSATYFLLISVHVQPEFIIGSLAILFTAIGVAFTGVAANLIGGIYILTTRPFRVGDLINTLGIEGIVQEIGINYSRLITIDRTVVKIPNGNFLNSSLLNYMEKSEETLNKIFPTDFFTSSKRFVIYKKMVELKLDIIDPPIPIKSVRERLDKVCNEYSDVFGAKPLYYLGKHDFRQELYLIVRAFNSYTIFNAWPYFTESLMTGIYQELQQRDEK